MSIHGARKPWGVRKDATQCVECLRALKPFGDPHSPSGVARAGGGRCRSCYMREYRHARQPLGRPRAQPIAEAEFVDRVLDLRSVVGPLPREDVAARLGMKLYSYDRALARARRKGLL